MPNIPLGAPPQDPRGAWRARARAYNGGLGRSPQRGPGTEPLVRGLGGEAETLLAFGRSMELANLPTFIKKNVGQNYIFFTIYYF